MKHTLAFWKLTYPEFFIPSHIIGRCPHCQTHLKMQNCVSYKGIEKWIVQWNMEQIGELAFYCSSGMCARLVTLVDLQEHNGNCFIGMCNHIDQQSDISVCMQPNLDIFEKGGEKCRSKEIW